MIRVLVISDLWRNFPGGAETLIGRLTDRLNADPEIDVAVITGYWDHRAEDFPIHASAVGIGDDHHVGAGIIAGAIDHYRPDVILTHHLYAYEFAPELAATGIPVVQVVLNRGRLECASLAVFISEWVADRCGIDYDRDMVIRPWAEADVIAETHGDAVGFVKPIAHKGVEMVYEIARQLPEQRFVILRGEWVGLEIIRPAANIEFMDPVTNMAEFYARCGLLLMPSISEDAGTVAQEATINGLPCVSSNVEGLNETNGGGLRLDPFDVGAWVDTVRAVLTDPDACEAVVRSQRAWADSLGTPGALFEFTRRVKALA